MQYHRPTPFQLQQSLLFEFDNLVISDESTVNLSHSADELL